MTSIAFHSNVDSIELELLILIFKWTKRKEAWKMICLVFTFIQLFSVSTTSNDLFPHSHRWHAVETISVILNVECPKTTLKIFRRIHNFKWIFDLQILVKHSISHLTEKRIILFLGKTNWFLEHFEIKF